MTITDKVPGGVPSASLAAIEAGLATMGMPDLDVTVTCDFVGTVRECANESDYHDERNGGSVAARTIVTPDGQAVVIANWETLSTLTDPEIERILAHETGHAAINGRAEEAWGDISSHFEDHYWNFQVGYGAAVAVDEYRCEAAVYKAGYGVEQSRDDAGLVDDLFGLNLQLFAADHDYQTHLDVVRLRDDVLRVVVFHLRYMGTIAARHLHHDPIDTGGMNQYARANWERFVAPSWRAFLDLYRPIPDARTPWPSPAATEASVRIVDLAFDLTQSLGFEATEEAFWIRVTDSERRARLERANAEAALRGLAP